MVWYKQLPVYQVVEYSVAAAQNSECHRPLVQAAILARRLTFEYLAFGTLVSELIAKQRLKTMRDLAS